MVADEHIKHGIRLGLDRDLPVCLITAHPA
jgi:hypothetical protein